MNAHAETPRLPAPKSVDDWQRHMEREWLVWCAWLAAGGEHERSQVLDQLSRVPVEAFESSAHRALRRAMGVIAEEGGTPDLESMTTAAKDPRTLRAIGGWEGLYDVYFTTPTHWLPSWETHERGTHKRGCCREGFDSIGEWLCGEMRARQQQATLASAAKALTEGRGEDVVEILDSLYDYAEPVETDITGTGLIEATLLDVMRVEARGPMPASSVKSGHPELDEHITWDPGSLYVIGGPPGAGKSSVMLALLDGWARRGVVGGYVSIEDGVPVLAPRLASRATGMPLAVMSNADIVAKNPAVLKLLNHMQRDEVWLGNIIAAIHKGAHIETVRAAMRRLVRRHGARVLVVDYLHAIRSRVRGDQRRHELKEFGSALKAEAAQLGVPLLLGAQLSRPDKMKKEPRPTKRDIRDCGEIEEMADYVFVLWHQRRRDRRVFIIDKAKNGPAPVDFEMGWDGPAARVTSFTRIDVDYDDGPTGPRYGGRNFMGDS